MRVKDERRAKAKTDSTVLTVQTLVGSAEKAKTLAAENPERVPITRNDDMNESANAYQAHNDPVDPGSDDGAEALDNEDDEENDTFSSYVALDDVTVSRQLNWMRNDLDPEVSAQLVQASAQAYLSFRKRTKEKVKAKQKVRAKADILFDRHIFHWRTVHD